MQPIEILSKGFKRRVGLAQALLHDPPALVLDEPTDGLDPNQKHEVRELIRRMAPEKAIIISTHILEEVSAVCTRAIIIARGHLIVDATAERAGRHRPVARRVLPRAHPQHSGLWILAHGRSHQRTAAARGGPCPAASHRRRPPTRPLRSCQPAFDLRPALVVARRELAAYFATPVATVFIVVFLALAGVLTFSLGNFFARGQADLVAFFSFLPWLFLLFVPALTMRLWAEERRLGTIELLLTLPIAPWQAVLGKFLAAWAFCAIALALTFPFWITVNLLGSPENGVILSGYIGSLLVAGAFLAIGSAHVGAPPGTR